MTQDPMQVIGITGLPIIHPGDDLIGMICGRVRFCSGDILTIASSVYSKSKGHVRRLSMITPSARAERIGQMNGEDPRFIQAVLDASSTVLMEHPFILSEMPNGHVGVRAGADLSNIEDGQVILLPPDPARAAEEVRKEILRITGAEIGVIITDTVGRAFRRGQTGHAIGWSGMPAIRDFRGDTDLFGHELKITEEAVIDEIAGFANFVMGESNNGVPAVVFRNCPAWKGHDSLFFNPDEDLFRKMLKERTGGG